MNNDEEKVVKGQKFDDGKELYSLIPPFALREIARNLTLGSKKYGKNNWKNVEDAKTRYLDALYRHLEAYRRGEVYDSESAVSDLHNLTAVAVNCMFLLEFEYDPKLVLKKD